MALVLDGSTQNADIASPTDFAGGFPYSVLIWCKPDAQPVSANSWAIEFGLDDGTEYAGQRLNATGSLAGLQYRTGGSTTTENTANTYTTGWNLLVAVYASSTDKRMYLNGNIVDNAAFTDTDAAFSAEYVTLGSYGPIGSEGGWFDGKIAHCCAWDTVELSEADVEALWNAGNGVLPNTIENDNVVLYLPLVHNAVAVIGTGASTNGSPSFDTDDPIAPIANPKVPVVDWSGMTLATVNPAATTISLNAPAVLPYGDLDVIVVANSSSSNNPSWTTTPDGYTKQFEIGDATSDSHIAVFTRIAPPSPADPLVITMNATLFSGGWRFRVSGHSADYWHKHGLSVVGTAFGVTIPSITTRVPNCLLFYVTGYDGSDGLPVIVTGEGWIERGELQVGTGGNVGVTTAFGSKDHFTASDSGNPIITYDDSDGVQGIMFAISPIFDAVDVVPEEIKLVRKTYTRQPPPGTMIDRQKSFSKGLIGCWVPDVAGQRFYDATGRGMHMIPGGASSPPSIVIGQFGATYQANSDSSTGTADNHRRFYLPGGATDENGLILGKYGAIACMAITRIQITAGNYPRILSQSNTGSANGGVDLGWTDVGTDEQELYVNGDEHTAAGADTWPDGEFDIAYYEIDLESNGDPRFFKGRVETGSAESPTYTPATGETDFCIGNWNHDSSTTSRHFNGDIYGVYLWGRALMQGEHIALIDNPWRIFKPRTIFVGNTPNRKLVYKPPLPFAFTDVPDDVRYVPITFFEDPKIIMPIPEKLPAVALLEIDSKRILVPLTDGAPVVALAPIDGAIAALVLLAFSGVTDLTNATPAGDIDASIDLTFTQVAALIGVGELIGTPSLAFSGTPLLLGRGELTANPLLGFSLAPDLQGRGELASNPLLTLSVAADLISTNEINATTTLVFSGTPGLTGLGELTASPTLLFSTVSALEGLGELTATPSLAFSGAAALLGLGELIASPTLTFSLNPLLSGDNALLASTSLVFSEDADLHGIGDLGATPSLVLSLGPDLHGIGELVGSPTLTFSETADLFGVGALAALPTIAISANPTLQSTNEISANPQLAFTLVPIMGSALLANVDLSFTEVADLLATGELAGATSLAFTEAANLTGQGELEGNPQIAFSGAPTLQANGKLDAAATIAFLLSPSLTTLGSLEADATIIISLVAALTSIQPVADVDALVYVTRVLAAAGYVTLTEAELVFIARVLDDLGYITRTHDADVDA